MERTCGKTVKEHAVKRCYNSCYNINYWIFSFRMSCTIIDANIVLGSRSKQSL